MVVLVAAPIHVDYRMCFFSLNISFLLRAYYRCLCVSVASPVVKVNHIINRVRIDVLGFILVASSIL